MRTVINMLQKSISFLGYCLLGAEALVFGMLTLLIVRLLPLRLYGRLLQGWKHDRTAPCHLAARIRRVMNIVEIVMPQRSRCLVCAIAAKTMFSIRGYEATLSLGVRKNDSELKAHAWLSAGNLLVTGKQNSALYTEIGAI